ncbi:inositol monophosphatase family protein [Williamsia muralis]|uniref:inositol monophosphatase family protein n=1 Tax=Williamsia marianensis TaxID=85044 RepID=UPI0037FAC32E
MIKHQSVALFEALSREVAPLFEHYRSRLGDLSVGVKSDRSFVSAADTEIESLIVGLICAHDPSARILAEEATNPQLRSSADHIWVVDPIDGTSEFLKAGAREFCSTVALIEKGVPTACWVLAPEMGRDGTPVEIRLYDIEDGPYVNGVKSDLPALRSGRRSASATRSASAEPRDFERKLLDAGVRLKTRTTSQTLDQVRVACDITRWCDATHFDWFFRQDQKLWDGAAGMALALAQDLAVVDATGDSLIPMASSVLADQTPVNESVLICAPAALAHLAPIVAGR